MLFEYTSFAVSTAEGLRLAVYTPVAESDTERRLAGLMRQADRIPRPQSKAVRAARKIAGAPSASAKAAAKRRAR
jgi:hypothetical protein